jgi:phasin
MGRGAKASQESHMTMDPMKAFEIPAEMRKMAEQSVEQARKAFDGFMSAANTAVAQMEDRANAARSGALDVGGRAMAFAQRNIAASFDFAQKLVRAADTEEVMKLQREYIESQIKALNEQAKELGEAATRAARDTVKPS